MMIKRICKTVHIKSTSKVQHQIFHIRQKKYQKNPEAELLHEKYRYQENPESKIYIKK